MKHYKCLNMRCSQYGSVSVSKKCAGTTPTGKCDAQRRYPRGSK